MNVARIPGCTRFFQFVLRYYILASCHFTSSPNLSDVQKKFCDRKNSKLMLERIHSFDIPRNHKLVKRKCMCVRMLLCGSRTRARVTESNLLKFSQNFHSGQHRCKINYPLLRQKNSVFYKFVVFILKKNWAMGSSLAHNLKLWL